MIFGDRTDDSNARSQGTPLFSRLSDVFFFWFSCVASKITKNLGIDPRHGNGRRLSPNGADKKSCGYQRLKQRTGPRFSTSVGRTKRFQFRDVLELFLWKWLYEYLDLLKGLQTTKKQFFPKKGGAQFVSSVSWHKSNVTNWFLLVINIELVFVGL